MRKIILLVIFFCLSLHSVFAQQNKIKIVVASFSAEDLEVANKVVNSLTLSLSKYEMFEVVSPSLIDTSDIVISGEVASLKVDKKVGQIKLKLKAQDRAGELISKMEITGTSSAKLDYKGKEKSLIDEAILDAANLVRENLLISLTKVGIVKYVKPDKSISITLGEIDNLRKGAEIIAIREDKKIALYEIFEVEKMGSTARVIEKFSHLEVAPNDKVKIIFNPQEEKKKKKEKKHKLKPWQTAMAVVTLGAIVYFSSDKDEKPLPTPPPSTTKKVVITLTALPSLIPADNTTTSIITATVKDADTNVAVPDGTVVNFKTGLGMIIQITATKDGKATAKVQSSIAGQSTITAEVENNTSSVVVTFSSYKIVVSANPENILSDGISTSIIIANVREASTGAAVVGTTVNFLTSAGGLTPSSAITDSMGTASTILTSSTTPGIARVSIVVESITSYQDVNFSTATITSITLLATPSSIPADGITTSTITATVKDPQTNKFLPDGTIVEFTTTKGTLLGDVVTTSGGKASTKIISDTSPGAAIITAKVDRFSATTQVNFTPLNITITAEPPMIIATGKSTSKITAVVSDVNNKPSPNGTVVYFTTTKGSIISPVTTFDGVAGTTLTSETVSSSSVVTVTATSGGTSTSCSVLFIPSEPSIVVIIPDKNVLPADNVSYTNIIVVVKDKENNLVSGVDVELTTTLGTFSNGQSVITVKTVNGIVSDKIKSQDAGFANIQAKVADISTSTIVEFTQLKITVSALPTSILANSTSTTIITVDVVDAKTNTPQDSIPLTLTTSDGLLTNALGVTNAQGKFTTTLRSSTTAGFVRVEVKSGSAVGSATVVFTPLGVSSITLSASPQSIPADGVSTSIITATVRDNYGNFVQDGTQLNFTSSDPASKITLTSYTEGGVAVATLTSSTFANKVLIEATFIAISGNISSYVQVTFSAGTPAYVRIAPPDLNLHGWDLLGNTTVITAYIYDSNHNPVSDGTIVNFTTEGGMITALSTTLNGVASATLTSTGTFPLGSYGTIGYSTITASSGPAFDTTVVLFSGKPFTMTLTALPTTIKGTGGKSTIVAKVYDINGNPVDSGFPVKFMTTLGGFNPEPIVKGEGDAPVAEITSSTFGEIHSFEQNRAEVTLYGWEATGTAIITAICGDASQTVNVTLTP